MSTTREYLRPVRLLRRCRRGVVIGMDEWQITFLAAAALVLLIFVKRFGPLGLLQWAPLYLLFGITALTSIHGVSTPGVAGLWLMKQVRRTASATTQIFRPEQPRRVERIEHIFDTR